MKLRGSEWGIPLTLIRVAAKQSQDQLAKQLHRDRAYVSRVETNKTMITSDEVLHWIRSVGGRKLLDQVIRQLQSLRSILDFLDTPPELLQA